MHRWRGGAQLADVRSWREFSGGGHDYPFPMPTGRIPTSVWAHWGPSTYVGGDFFVSATGALLPLTQTSALWSAWGLEVGDASRRRVLFYCGSGWRSAVAWCIARLLGHDNAANYDGGFLEWTLLEPRAAELPIERGDGEPNADEVASWPSCACCAPHPPPPRRVGVCLPSLAGGAREVRAA